MKPYRIQWITLATLLGTAPVVASQELCAPDLAITDTQGIIVVVAAPQARTFRRLRVVTNGVVSGQLTENQPYLCVPIDAGAHVVGVDLGSRAMVRRRLTVASKATYYLRYTTVNDIKAVGLLGKTEMSAVTLEPIAADEAKALALVTLNSRKRR